MAPTGRKPGEVGELGTGLQVGGERVGSGFWSETLNEVWCRRQERGFRRMRKERTERQAGPPAIFALESISPATPYCLWAPKIASQLAAPPSTTSSCLRAGVGGTCTVAHQEWSWVPASSHIFPGMKQLCGALHSFF